jgi:uncharacterized protein YndB with AHSA1/START domain
MAARRSDDTPSTERELTITRVFDAPPGLVFKAWTEPERLVRWSGPEGFTTTSCAMDVRPGGSYRSCIRSPEGTDHCMQGVYREIAEPERLVFTFAWEDAEGRPGREMLVTVTFAEDDGKTRMTFHQAVFESVEDRDGHREGWSSSFDLLEAYLAKA